MGSCYIKDVLEVAQNEIGYKESGNNWTKYARDLDKVHYFNGNKQNVAWCSTFLNWCILKACIPSERTDTAKKWDALYFTFEPSTDNCACGVPYWKQYFKNHGALHSSPKVGDIAFIGSGHVGIVEKVNGSKITTIEGNHGDKVARVSRTTSECSGFGRPRYDGYEPSPAPTPTPEPKAYDGKWPTLPVPGTNRYYYQRYDKGEYVKDLQRWIKWMIPSALPVYGVDGDIGSETLGAVKDCQKILGVTADGFYGRDTEKAAKAYKK